MKKILITRPEAEIAPLTERLLDLGLPSFGESLLNIQPVNTNKSLLNEALSKNPQALLVTSKRALEIADAWNLPRTLPLLAVGAATAHYATTLGYRCLDYCETGEAFAAMTERHYNAGRFLYLRGEDISVDIAAALQAKGFQVDSVIVYRAIPITAFSPRLMEAITLQQISAALFFSQRTAETYVDLVHAHGLSEKHNTLQAICISEAVANRLRGLPWQHIHSAALPDMEHMIATIIRVCSQ